MLEVTEMERYARQIQLPQVGEAGQLKLKGSKVLVIGAGGLGCPVLQYLCAAGVGTIGLVDADVVSLSNLQRQPLYSTADIGHKKVSVAREKLKVLNPEVLLKIYDTRFDKSQIALVQNYDIVIDATDNFPSRYLINDACVVHQKPLIYGAVQDMQGQVSVFLFQGGPSYRCLFPEPPLPELAPSCTDIGVLGVLPGLVGMYMATEVLKIILNLPGILSGKLLCIDAQSYQPMLLNIAKNELLLAQQRQNITYIQNMDYEHFCHITSIELPNISWEYLYAHADNYQIIDVREPHELPKVPWTQVINIPLNQLAKRYQELNINQPTVVFCQKGVRSKKAGAFLSTKGMKNIYIMKSW